MPEPRDYKKFPHPRLWSVEILVQLKDMKMHEFTSTEISDLFQIPLAEACTRINVLKKWKCIREVRAGLYPHVYEITKWGHKYVEKNLEKILKKISEGVTYKSTKQEKQEKQ